MNMMNTLDGCSLFVSLLARLIVVLVFIIAFTTSHSEEELKKNKCQYLDVKNKT